MLKPNPVDRSPSVPFLLAFEKGVNKPVCNSFGIPIPSSFMAISTDFQFVVYSIFIFPPLLENFIALETKFIKTLSNLSTSPFTG